MTRRPFGLTALASVLLLLATRAEALEVRTIEFSGLDEAQILNVRSALSLARTQLDATSVVSENRLDYLMRLAPREVRLGLEAFGFDFAADVFGVQGNKVLNAKALARFGTYNWEKFFFDGRWTGEGTSTTNPRITDGGHNYRMSDYWIKDGSFLRLRTLVLGYSLPTKLLMAPSTIEAAKRRSAPPPVPP